MMTEEHIKEAISIKFVELIASAKGYKTGSSYPDYGTDLEVKEVDFRIENERKRYFDTGRELKFQLKATTENLVHFENEIIKYDLNTSTFNDLIKRKKTRTPLILILFVLPKDKSQWIRVSCDELIAKRCAYWYYPTENISETFNSGTKRIEINQENYINGEVLDKLFEEYS